MLMLESGDQLRTEQNEAIEKMQISEGLFRVMVLSAQDSIIILGGNGNIIFWNEAAEKMFGYSNDEVLGQDLNLLLAPHSLRELHHESFPHFQQTGLESDIGKTVELSGLRRDGREFPLELSFATVKVNDSWHSIGIARDISERKQAEDDLRRQEHFLRPTIDGLNANICVIDAQGKILITNRAWKAYGTENNAVEETICEGFNYLDACKTTIEVEKDDVEEFAAGIRAVIAGTLREFVKEYPCHAPEVQCWYLCRVNQLQVSGANYAVISHENITNRKVIEEELATKSSHLQLLMQHIPDLIWMKNTDGIYLNCNRKFERLYGAVEADIIGKTDYDFVPQAQAEILANPAATRNGLPLPTMANKFSLKPLKHRCTEVQASLLECWASLAISPRVK
jgi:PAS domain S-box-containing protein